MVHNMTLRVVPGNNFFILPYVDEFRTRPGDVLSYHVYLSSGSGSPNASFLPSSSQSATASFAQSQRNPTPSSEVIKNVLLYGFVPYEARISIRVMTPGILPLRIAVEKFQNAVPGFRKTITVQTPVSRLQFNYQPIIRVNTSRSIGFELFRGTNSSCDWHLTGSLVDIAGSVNYTTSKNITNTVAFETLRMRFEYPNDIPTDVIFFVNCSNAVSTLSENVTISVRRNISCFNASLCFAFFAYTHARTCWTAEAFGDVVRFKWTLENDVFRKADVVSKFHNSSLPGNKTFVSVSAFNVVSQEDLTLSLDVLKNPLTVQFGPALIVASGDTFNITPIVNWSPYANGTALYKDYGINISDALQTFIDFPTFGAKIDDGHLHVFGNISNGTLVTYKFPPAGAKSVTHVVLVEAIGHPEMNREIDVVVLDRVERLQIVSRCSKQVVLGRLCLFFANFSGSDVVCNWSLGSEALHGTCNRMDHRFNALGNLSLTVNAYNRISSRRAVFGILVVQTLPASSSISSLNMTQATNNDRSSIMASNSFIEILSTISATAQTLNAETHLEGSGGLTLSSKFDISPSNTFLSRQIIDTSVIKASMTSKMLLTTPWLNLYTIQDSNESVFVHLSKISLSSFVSSSTSNQDASQVVTVQEQISGFQIYVYHNPLGKRVDVLFAIDLGTDVSYLVNFGDASTPILEKVRELGKNISVYHVYAKPGYYNVSVALFRIGGQNITKYAEIFITDTCKLISAILYGASEDIGNPSLYLNKGEIVMALKAVLNCTDVPHLKYSWKVERLNSGMPDGVPVHLAGTNDSIFRFPTNLTGIGSYKVRAVVENRNDRSSLTRLGYFTIILDTLDVSISCGTTRNVAINEPLVLNATVIAGSVNVKYEWFCDQQEKVTCFGDVIKRNTSFVWFPEHYFNAGDVYVFVLKVNDGKRPGLASQKVTFGHAATTLGLCLR